MGRCTRRFCPSPPLRSRVEVVTKLTPPPLEGREYTCSLGHQLTQPLHCSVKAPPHCLSLSASPVRVLSSSASAPALTPCASHASVH
jgi:hypothetical protein